MGWFRRTASTPPPPWVLCDNPASLVSDTLDELVDRILRFPLDNPESARHTMGMGNNATITKPATNLEVGDLIIIPGFEPARVTHTHEHHSMTGAGTMIRFQAEWPDGTATHGSRAAESTVKVVGPSISRIGEWLSEIIAPGVDYDAVTGRHTYEGAFTTAELIAVHWDALPAAETDPARVVEAFMSTGPWWVPVD